MDRGTVATFVVLFIVVGVILIVHPSWLNRIPYLGVIFSRMGKPRIDQIMAETEQERREAVRLEKLLRAEQELFKARSNTARLREEIRSTRSSNGSNDTFDKLFPPRK